MHSLLLLRVRIPAQKILRLPHSAASAELKARDRLIKALENTTEPAIQLTLVDAIAKIGDAPSMQALERQRQQYQNDDDSGIRIFLDEVFKSLTQKSM